MPVSFNMLKSQFWHLKITFAECKITLKALLLLAHTAFVTTTRSIPDLIETDMFFAFFFGWLENENDEPAVKTLSASG